MRADLALIEIGAKLKLLGFIYLQMNIVRYIAMEYCTFLGKRNNYTTNTIARIEKAVRAYSINHYPDLFFFLLLEIFLDTAIFRYRF